MLLTTKKRFFNGFECSQFYIKPQPLGSCGSQSHLIHLCDSVKSNILVIIQFSKQKKMMMNVSNSINRWFETILEEYIDKRTANYPLMSSFNVPITILFTYLFFVLYAGPRLMQNRKPFSLKWILITYNLILSLVNLFFFFKILIESNYCRYLLNVDYHSSNRFEFVNAKNLTYWWIYLWSKYLDMFDTIFFVLRKKQSQITGLHVYHHASVATMGWFYFRLRPFNIISGAFGLINAPIHTIMYAYYGLAAIGPHMQKYLWWKRYITQIQIFQFILLFIYAIYFVTYQNGYPSFYVYDLFFQTTLYLILFTRFYIRSYVKNQPKSVKNE